MDIKLRGALLRHIQPPEQEPEKTPNLMDLLEEGPMY